MTPGIQVISESKEAEIDNNIWKIVLLLVLGILTSIASVAGFNRLLSGWDSVFIFPTLIAFIFFLVFTVLQIFLIKSRVKFALIAFLESFAPLVLFQDRIYPQPEWVLLGGTILAFIFLFSAMNRGRQMLADSVRLSFFRTSRMFLSRAALGFFFLFTTLIYLNYFSWGLFNEKMGKTMVAGMLSSSEPIMNVIVPGVPITGTAEELIRALAASQLRDSSQKFLSSIDTSAEAQFRYLPARDQEIIIGQFSSQLEKVFQDKFEGFKLSDKVSDIAFSFISDYAAKLNSSSPWIIPISVCILFFLAVKGIFAVIYWLIALIAFLIFKLLIAFGFARISSEERNREFVLL